LSPRACSDRDVDAGAIRPTAIHVLLILKWWPETLPLRSYKLLKKL